MTSSIHRSLHASRRAISETAGNWRTQEDSNLWPLPSEDMPRPLLSRFCALFTVNTARTERESHVVAYTVYANTKPGLTTTNGRVRNG